MKIKVIGENSSNRKKVLKDADDYVKITILDSKKPLNYKIINIP